MAARNRGRGNSANRSRPKPNFIGNGAGTISALQYGIKEFLGRCRCRRNPAIDWVTYQTNENADSLLRCRHL